MASYLYVYNGKRIAPSSGKVLGKKESVDPHNPLNLPAYTIRCKFEDGYTPPQPIRTQVSASPNVWDITYIDTDWEDMLGDDPALLEVLGANTTGVTNMTSMFRNCSSLTNVPLFDTNSATNMSYMFKDCTAVQSGALALYQQASSQSTPPTTYTGCFTNCGVNTTTGAAELAQIPTSWGGTMA